MEKRKPIGFRRIRGRVVPIYENNAAKGSVAAVAGVGGAYAIGKADRAYGIKAFRRVRGIERSAGVSVAAASKLKDINGPLFTWGRKQAIKDGFTKAIKFEQARLKSINKLSKFGMAGAGILATYGVAKLYQGLTKDESNVRPGAIGTALGAPITASAAFYGEHGKRSTPLIKAYLKAAALKAAKIL